MNPLAKRITALAAWWLWMPAVYGLVWLLWHHIFEGYAATQWIDQLMQANFWSGGALLWIWLLVGFIGSVVICSVDGFDYPGIVSQRSLLVTATAFGLIAVLCAVQLGRVVWDNDKDLARYYNQATVFYAPDLHHVPDSLSRLVNGARTGDGTRCELIGKHDVPSCIKQGTLPEDGWEPRVGSLDGAKIAIKRRSGDIQKVSLEEDTMAYLNAWHGQPASWSGILNGGGINVPIGGVAQWTGEGQPTLCLFDGQYKLDRAFGGGRSNSLDNLLADRYPGLNWNIQDVWGFCSDGQPIVVVPMIRKIYFKDRTVETAGGIVLVQGDHGHTKLTYQPEVKAGQYPGPVYPMTLVATQRDQVSWAAGRENRKRNGFGYEPASSEAQAGNVSEFLLRDKVTGRLQWVTPLTLRHSSSELFVAYVVSFADEVSDRQLNQLSVYVLDPNDPRRVNIDTLEADARNFFAQNAGTFISNGGKLLEFTPVDGDIWRGFGELNGQVVYRLDISASSKIEPRLVSLEPGASTPDKPSEASNTTCGKPLAHLTPSELTNCIRQLADELAKRQNPSSK